jgi:NADH-quinone oxidoreductase subunit N
MWTPDVYEGAPTSVTAYFAAAPKMAAMALFVAVLVGPFGKLVAQWQQILFLIAVGSMVLGAYAAISQSNIKRLLAYSSIGNIGYALVGLAAGTPDGYRAVLVYMAIYLAMTLGAFACILCLRRDGRAVEEIKDLAGISRSRPGLAILMAIFMFSMAGIPPLAGFFGKLYVFLAAVEAKLYVLAVLGVLTSVVAAYYYLRIVKTMYFDEPTDELDRGTARSLGIVQVVAGIVVLFFFLVPGPLIRLSEAAIKSLGQL